MEKMVQRMELSVTQKTGNRYYEWMDADVRHWTNDAWRKCVGDPHRTGRYDIHEFKTLIIMVARNGPPPTK